ncbi:MAG: LruC domain-containing protein [Bacteroidales bacterium]|jgi:LruC domain-containing protein
MKLKIAYLLLFISVLSFNGCVSDFESSQKSDYFDFATMKRYKLDLKYSKTNDSKIFFEIYKENPVNVNGQKINNLKPIGKGFTDKNGRANFEVSMPAGLNDFYIYTTNLGIPSLMKAVVENNIVRFVTYENETKSTGTFGVTTRDNFWNTSLVKWDYNGQPSVLMTPDVVSSRLLADIGYTLPEGISIPATKPYLLSDNTSTIITEDANVYLTFLHEGAGYRNTMGYFVYQTNNPPTSVSQIEEILVFPNVSYSSESYGCLSSGDKVQLKYKNPQTNKWSPVFPAGTSIGWVMVSDGFVKNSSKERGSVGGNNKNKFYSISSLNPESTPSQRRHCILLYDQQTQYSIIGFEDMLTTQGDNDYEDVLFYASANPIDAIEPPSNSVETPAPVQTSYSVNYSGNLAFEDLWPYQGDYDMNDLVMEYNIDQVYNQDNKIISCSGYYKLSHVGAQIKDGFGFQLGADDSKIQSFSLTSNYTDPYSLIQRNANGLESNQNLATVVLFTNAKDVFSNSPNERIFNFNIVFSTPINASNLMTPPYNSFIITNGNSLNLSRGQEVHLPNYPPTAKADRSLLGKGADKSNESLGLYYISESNFPFAINIPTTFVVPTEMTRIDAFYPKFNDWVNSSGATNNDWYNFPISK